MVKLHGGEGEDSGCALIGGCRHGEQPWWDFPTKEHLRKAGGSQLETRGQHFTCSCFSSCYICTKEVWLCPHLGGVAPKAVDSITSHLRGPERLLL